MLRSENVATPATAATVLVPDNVPAPGFEFDGIASTTFPVKPVATLFPASSAVTWIGGVIVAFAGVVLGGTVNARCVAAPGATSNGVLVAPAGPVAAAVRVYPVPTLLMLRLEKVATPETAATVALPESVPPPGFVPSATVTVPVKVGSVLPKPSSAVTCTAGVMDALAAVLLGCTVNTSCVAAP